jgi:very-short-patch-repair endonuclease
MGKANSENFYLYNRDLKSRARNLRSNMTKAEACLWKYVLQGRRLKGIQFRRQRPVMNYIADYMSKELMLIIEVDGITHTYEEVALNDERRQEVLESVGFKFLRFTDEEILTDINGVRRKLEDWIEENGKTPPL